MLKDEVRTRTYMRAILDNAHQFKGKAVLDVGCGTGILSMFAAKAGARAVYAVDMSSIAQQATQIVKDNGFEGVITVYQAKMEDVALPEKVSLLLGAARPRARATAACGASAGPACLRACPARRVGSAVSCILFGCMSFGMVCTQVVSGPSGRHNDAGKFFHLHIELQTLLTPVYT